MARPAWLKLKYIFLKVLHVHVHCSPKFVSFEDIPTLKIGNLMGLWDTGQAWQWHVESMCSQGVAQVIDTAFAVFCFSNVG
jgi:hypothetical protein